jgi:cobalt/nickel transport system permease protein
VGEHMVFFGVVEGIFTQVVYSFLTKKEEKVAL